MSERSKFIVREFFLKAFPNLFWIVFVLLCIFGGITKNVGEIAESSFEIWQAFWGIISSVAKWIIGIWSKNDPILVCVISLIFIIIAFIFVAFCAAIISMIILPVTVLMWIISPFLSFDASNAISDMVFCFAGMIIILTLVGAGYFHLGTFLEDSTHVSGSHYEVSYDSFRDVLVSKKVTDYDGGGEFILNYMLFLLRAVIIATVGAIVFVVEVVKFQKQ